MPGIARTDAAATRISPKAEITSFESLSGALCLIAGAVSEATSRRGPSRCSNQAAARLYRLSEAADAHRLSGSRHFKGKLVFQVR
jgi:hypothetical protein